MTDAARDDEMQHRAFGHSEARPRPAPGPGEPVTADEATIEAVGKASEALECVERARGYLYSFHQLIGHADIQFGEAAELLRGAGHPAEADRLDVDIVGLNVLDGRWTFQVIEEFDDLYYRTVTDAVRALERRLMDGRRHVLEARMKEGRRTDGRPGHESRPPTAHSPDVVTEES